MFFFFSNLFTCQTLDFLQFEARLNTFAIHIMSPCVELFFPLSSETLSESCLYLLLAQSPSTPETGSLYLFLAVLELIDSHWPLPWTRYVVQCLD